MPKNNSNLFLRKHINEFVPNTHKPNQCQGTVNAIASKFNCTADKLLHSKEL